MIFSCSFEPVTCLLLVISSLIMSTHCSMGVRKRMRSTADFPPHSQYSDGVSRALSIFGLVCSSSPGVFAIFSLSAQISTTADLTASRACGPSTFHSTSAWLLVCRPHIVIQWPGAQKSMTGAWLLTRHCLIAEIGAPDLSTALKQAQHDGFALIFLLLQLLNERA